MSNGGGATWVSQGSPLRVPTRPLDVHKQRVESSLSSFRPLHLGHDRALQDEGHGVVSAYNLPIVCLLLMDAVICLRTHFNQTFSLREAFFIFSFCWKNENSVLTGEQLICVADADPTYLRLGPNAMWTTFKSIVSHLSMASFYFDPDFLTLLRRSLTIPGIQCRTNDDDVLHAAQFLFRIQKRSKPSILEDRRARSSSPPFDNDSSQVTDRRAPCEQLSHENQYSRERRQADDKYAGSFPRMLCHFANLTSSPSV